MIDPKVPDKTDSNLGAAITAATRDGLPYLGDVNDVRALIGGPCSAYVTSYAAVAGGQMAGDALIQQVETAATELADIFLGRVEGYNLQPDWNTPGKVDAFVAKESRIAETDPDLRLRTLFLLMFTDMRRIIQGVDDGNLSLDDALAAVDGALGGVASILVGIPFSVYDSDA